MSTPPVFRLFTAVLAVWLALTALAGAARAQSAVPSAAGVQAELEALVRARAEGGGGDAPEKNGAAPSAARVEIVLGQLDPRLRLAPCDKIRVYVPPGARMWGRTRVGLRCEQGAVRWNVYWPVTVKVWGQALVAARPLAPGAVLAAGDVRFSEVDLTESPSPALKDPQELVGRSLSRGIDAGEGIRQGDLRLRRWFAAGEPVQLLLKGQGFAVAAEGTALSHGDEGRCARVRVDSGRVLCGLPVGERRAEVTL